MSEPYISYEPWRSLDPGKRYCLIDTMDLLQVYRRDRRLASMVETVRDGRTMLLVPSVVDECAAVSDMRKPDTSSPGYLYVGDECDNVCARLVGPLAEGGPDVEPGSRSDFDRRLVQTLRGWCIEFAAVRPEQSAIDGARMLNVEERYRDRRGVPLSAVDRLLLQLAIKNVHVDVLTDDSSLYRAVLAECGNGRASNVLSDYFGRLNMTACFLSKALKNGFINCTPVRDTIVYRAGYPRPGAIRNRQNWDDVVAEAHLSPGCVEATYGPAFPSMERGGADDIVLALRSFVQLAVREWYCACGDANWAMFDREWSKRKRSLGTVQIAGKTRLPYYNTAKGILDRYRGRYCACSRPDERRLHEEFKAIMSADCHFRIPGCNCTLPVRRCSGASAAPALRASRRPTGSGRTASGPACARAPP